MAVIHAEHIVGRTEGGYESEANRVAGPRVRMPKPTLQQAACSFGGDGYRHLALGPRDPIGNAVACIVDDVLHSPGQQLDRTTRAFMEPRLGRDFSGVRLHTDKLSAGSAEAISARAYTSGCDVVFGRGRYDPTRRSGRYLLAHELTHVVQQEALPPSVHVVQRTPQGPGGSGIDPDVVAEREYGGSGAPKAQKCGRPSWCPAGFCDPYRSQQLAEYYRSKKALWLMAGISAAVSSRVVPLWREYLWGGSAPKNLSADFGKEFTGSPTSKKTTRFLYNELEKSLAAKPPTVPLYGATALDLKTQIPKAVVALDDPSSTDQMNFNIPRDIPGNLAGGVGKDQLTCPAGARPSPHDDLRRAGGTVMVARLSPQDLSVTPIVSYLIKDTIDLCPGDCGSTLEQVATVPLSQFEATGISGDVPFTVEFPAPFLGSFEVAAPLPATSGPTGSP